MANMNIVYSDDLIRSLAKLDLTAKGKVYNALL